MYDYAVTIPTYTIFEDAFSARQYDLYSKVYGFELPSLFSCLTGNINMTVGLTGAVR